MRSAPHCHADRLSDILDHFDILLLDGFGVINIGTGKTDDIDELLAVARAKGKHIFVLTNAASHPISNLHQKYQQWELGFRDNEIISSRCCVPAAIPKEAREYISLGQTVTALPQTRTLTPSDYAPSDYDRLDDANGFAFLGSVGWTKDDQECFEASLKKKMRPVLIGNPDIGAPQQGFFSAEPGYWAVQAMQRTGLIPLWFGKPHKAIFDLALARIEQLCGSLPDKKRIAMVGDSLHTDILGALAAGLSSVLVTGYGLLADYDVAKAIQKTGIAPHWQVSRL